MTARIAGFVTRAEAGLRPPKSVSRNVDPSLGGLAVHHGNAGTAGLPTHRHDKCVERWRGWQRFHQDDRGWSDIAYSFGVCDHGYVLAGRGLGVRTAANGTDDGNDRFLAACWLNWTETPTPACLDAFEWAILTVRKAGGGRAVKPHRTIKTTECPGDYLARHALAQWDGRTVSPPAPAPTPKPPQEDDVLTPDAQAWLENRLDAQTTHVKDYIRQTVDRELDDVRGKLDQALALLEQRPAR